MLARYRWLGLVLLITAVVGLGMILYQSLVLAPRTSDATRLMPLLSDLGMYATVILLGLPLVLIGALIARARRRIDHRPLRRRVLSTTLAAIVGTAVCIGCAAGVLATHPDFPLGPSLVASKRSPDGEQVAYLYRYFLGSLRAFVRAEGDLTMHARTEFANPAISAKPQLKWVKDGVKIVGPDGSPLAKGRPWTFGIGWH